MGDVSASLLNHLCTTQAPELKLFVQENEIMNMLQDSILVLYQIQNSNNPGTFCNIQNCIQYQQKELFCKQLKQKEQDNDSFINRERVSSIEINMNKDQKSCSAQPLKDLGLMIKDKDKEEFQRILNDHFKFSTEQFAQNVFEFGGIEPHFIKIKEAYQNNVQLDKGPYSIKEGFLTEIINDNKDKKKIDYSKENVIDLTDETVLRKINEKKMEDLTRLNDEQNKSLRNNRYFDQNNKQQDQNQSQRGYRQVPIVIDGGKPYQINSNKNNDNYRQKINYNSSSSSPFRRRSSERKGQKDQFQERQYERQEDKNQKSPLYFSQSNNYKDRDNYIFSDEDDYKKTRNSQYPFSQRQSSDYYQKQNQYNQKYFPSKQIYHNNKFNHEKESRSFRKHSPERRMSRRRSRSRSKEDVSLRNRESSYKRSQRSISSYRSSRSNSFSRDRESDSNDYYNRKNKQSPNQQRNYSPKIQHENEFQNRYNGNSHHHNQNYKQEPEKYGIINNKNNGGNILNNNQNKNERGYNFPKSQIIEESQEQVNKYDNLNKQRNEMNIQQNNNHIKDNNNFNRGNNSQYQQNQNNQVQSRSVEYKNNNYKNGVYLNNEIVSNDYKMNYIHDSTERNNRQYINPQEEQNMRIDDQNKQNMNGYYNQNGNINNTTQQNLEQKYNNDFNKQVNVSIKQDGYIQKVQPTMIIPSQQPPPPPLPPSFPPPPQPQFIQINQNKILPVLNYSYQNQIISNSLMKLPSNHPENVVDNSLLNQFNYQNNQGPNYLQRSMSEHSIQNINQINNNQIPLINNYSQQLPPQIIIGKVQNPLLRTCSLLTNQGFSDTQNHKWQNNQQV